MDARDASSIRRRPRCFRDVTAIVALAGLVLGTACDGGATSAGRDGVPGRGEPGAGSDARAGDLPRRGDGGGSGTGFPVLDPSCLDDGGELTIGTTVSLAEAPVTALAFGPDGELVVASESGRAELWRHPVRGGGAPRGGETRLAAEPVPVRSEGQVPIRALDVASDGNRLALGTDDGRVLLRSGPGGSIDDRITAREEQAPRITSVALAPGAAAVSMVDAGFSGNPTLWRPGTDETVALDTRLWTAGEVRYRTGMDVWDAALDEERASRAETGAGWSVVAGDYYGVPLVEAHRSDMGGVRGVQWWPEVAGRSISAIAFLSEAQRLVAVTGSALASVDLAPGEVDREPPIGDAAGASMLGVDESTRSLDREEPHRSLGLTRLGDSEVLLSVGAEGWSVALRLDGLEPLATHEHGELTAVATGPNGRTVVAGDAEGRVHALVCER